MKKLLIFYSLLIFCLGTVQGQTYGIIVRPDDGVAPAILDPNADRYTSKTTSGFGSNDIINSEIPYKVITPLIPEPTGDLYRGPSGSYSDIVRSLDGSGLYLFSDGANLLTRLRIGGLISGSKGYSLLLDTDQKFGPSGPNADPNYMPATNGNNGNPGFEFEIVLETNFRVAIYNVDGSSSPVLVASYAIATNSQISVAATTEGNNPDFFYDFYVPYAAMGLTSASMIRVAAATVMAPAASIGGPKSDVYGAAGPNYMEDWINIINQQQAFGISQLTTNGAGMSAPCTMAPVVDGVITSSSTAVTGSWTNSTYSSVTSATIRLYRDGVQIGSIFLSSPGTWSIPVSNLPDGSIITAKAQGPGESMCLSSNEVAVENCIPSNRTTAPGVTCADARGFEGTRVAGASIQIYKLSPAGYVLLADDATTTYKVTYPSATVWFYDDANDTSPTNACGAGPADIDQGAYMVTATLAPKCVSSPTTICFGNGSIPAQPVITSTLTDGLSTIKGSSDGSAVILFINDFFVQSVSPVNGLFTFNLTEKLSFNQTIKIIAVNTKGCVSVPATGTVSCYIPPPVVISNTNNNVTEGNQLKGTSAAVPGSTVTVYNASTQAVVGTAIVQVDNTWTLISPVIAAATTYNARITGHACGMSQLSNTVTAMPGTLNARCGTIITPVDELVSSVTGTVTSAVAGTVVILFADGDSIGTATTSTLNWTIPVNTMAYNKLYTGIVLTMSVSEPGKTAATCSESKTVACTNPLAPAVTPLITAIYAGEHVIYTISNSEDGILYSIRDAPDANNRGASIFGTGGSITASSDTFFTPGVYDLIIKASRLSGGGCTSSSSTRVIVMGALPLTLTTFNAKYDNGVAKLSWETVFEQDIEKFEVERSTNGNTFKKIGEVTAVGNSTLRNTYFYDDADAKSNVLYYRLRIIDRTTRVDKFSKVVVIRTDKGIVINQVAPNPFTDVINMSFDASGKMPLIISLKDMAGRTVEVVNYTTKKGLNNIPVNGLQRVPSGIYVLEVIAGDDRIHRELLIKK